MALGTLVIDERIYIIRSLSLGKGAILAEISLSAADAPLIPEDLFDWSLHAPDGSFVCQGRIALPAYPVLQAEDSVALTLSLEIEGKTATPMVARW